MSEYQYYEFQALDQPLTPVEQQAVARLSSRVEPHPRRAVFIYNYSDFPGDEKEILAKYYDAFFYLANWGSRQLAFRFPAALVDVEAMRQYTVVTTAYPSEAITVNIVGDYAILNLRLDEEEGFGWVDGEGWLDRMIGLREALLRRDHRVLYLAWLKAITLEYDVDETAAEPPVPPGLQELSPALASFVEYFDVPRDVLAHAATHSPALESPALDDAVLRRRIATLPLEEKEAFLLRLAKDEARLTLALHQRLGLLPAVNLTDAGSRRTVGELLSR